MTEQRIRELARDLEPVRPIPRLRMVELGVVASWAAIVFADWLAGGWAPRAASDSAWVTPSYLGALAGVALVAVGAISAALASAVPGREAAVRVGLRVTAVGAALALAGWALGVTIGPVDHGGEDLGSILGCATKALGLGVVPTLLACAFVAFAVLRRASVSAALAVGGGVALGAVAVHASCPSNSALHQLVAHTLAPAAAVILLTAPLAPLLGRWARRD